LTDYDVDLAETIAAGDRVASNEAPTLGGVPVFGDWPKLPQWSALVAILPHRT
jgi:hypothetical protein